jgi:hypothetical protein
MIVSLRIEVGVGKESTTFTDHTGRVAFGTALGTFHLVETLLGTGKRAVLNVIAKLA